MTTKLVWRLKEQPSTESLQGLVKAGILTNDEARQILFSSEDDEQRDKKSLEDEIKFLRNLVEKLSNNSSKIIETVKLIDKPYHNYPWYEPYKAWCTTGYNYTTGNTTTATISDTLGTIATYGQTSGTSSLANFSSIKTF